ncbi:MAG TPA: aldehyde dehydrogenase [Actinomycetota bacterium]|nr:aldehyde dehydrogenase [Actinomycetota bacterium]
MAREFKLLIDGEFVDAASGETSESRSPSDGELVATVAKGGAEDVNRAVSAARRAFDEGPWPSMKPAERWKIMRRVHEDLEERSAELAMLEAEDAGHTARMAHLFTVPYANEFWRYLGELGGKMSFFEPVDQYDFPAPAWHHVRREPVGVVGAITPWNYPYLMAMWKLSPALATGCTIVLKPASYTPSTTMALAEIIAESGIPPGVVNVVAGPGAAVGETLVTHPDVNKISFTGSTEIGRRIMQLGAGTVKRLTLELGGKSAAIVLDDADLEDAVPGAIWAMFMHCGQSCEAATRLLLPASLHDEFLAMMVERVEGLSIGPATDFESDLGPLINETQLQTVERYVQLGQDEGAKLLTGGERATGEGLENGAYYRPTIFADVDNAMTIAQEEIFGPVLSVIRYEGVDQAIRIANDSIYGLGGSVWSSDPIRAVEVAKRVKTGSVWINAHHILTPAAPFGGYKQSGFGREFGPWGLDEYLETKYIRVEQLAPKDKIWNQVIGA